MVTFVCANLYEFESDILMCLQALEPILTGYIETMDSATDKTLNPEFRKSTMADAKKIAFHQKICLMALDDCIEKHNIESLK